jgi:hypothetical protein
MNTTTKTSHSVKPVGQAVRGSTKMDPTDGLPQPDNAAEIEAVTKAIVMDLECLAEAVQYLMKLQGHPFSDGAEAQLVYKGSSLRTTARVRLKEGVTKLTADGKVPLRLKVFKRMDEKLYPLLTANIGGALKEQDSKLSQNVKCIVNEWCLRERHEPPVYKTEPSPDGFFAVLTIPTGPIVTSGQSYPSKRAAEESAARAALALLMPGGAGE